MVGETLKFVPSAAKAVRILASYGTTKVVP